MAFELKENPHRRFNLLTREWILVSPHRTQRPWLGQVEKVASEVQPTYDPACYMCPGNSRAVGARNPDYKTTFVFDNDYPALLPDTPEGGIDVNGLLVARSEAGTCRVVCFSPRHDLTIARMSLEELRPVMDLWVEQSRELGSRQLINYVQIFENRGAMMGASNPHPHGQIWATEHIPDEAAAEVANQNAYLSQQNACLLCNTLKVELEQNQRIVCQNEEFVVLVPFWAVWPFETLVLPRAHLGSLLEFKPTEQRGLADILKQLTTLYDRLFATSFPYTMGFHQRPTDGDLHPECHFHGHFYPPLLRSATVRKFMVGFEMLGMPQRDITPETAAGQLRGGGL